MSSLGAELIGFNARTGRPVQAAAGLGSSGRLEAGRMMKTGPAYWRAQAAAGLGEVSAKVAAERKRRLTLAIQAARANQQVEQAAAGLGASSRLEAGRTMKLSQAYQAYRAKVAQAAAGLGEVSAKVAAERKRRLTMAIQAAKANQVAQAAAGLGGPDGIGSYLDLSEDYYKTFQHDNWQHPGSEGWSSANVPGWGENPNLQMFPRRGVGEETVNTGRSTGFLFAVGLVGALALFYMSKKGAHG